LQRADQEKTASVLFSCA